MLSKAQKKIIRDVCSLQYQSLTEILMEVDLGETSEGQTYESFFQELGLNRKHFDHELIHTIHQFEAVKKDPEKLFELEELDLIVFKKILTLFDHKWASKYPKALANLWNKLLILNIAEYEKTKD